MLKRKRTKYWVVTAGAVCLSFAALLLASGRSGQTQKNQQKQTATILRRGEPSVDKPPTAKELDDAATPIVDLNDGSTSSSDRQSKNARYDGHDFVKTDLDPRVAAQVRDKDTSVSDVPWDKSDLVIEGHVIHSAAFLSNDKGDVYSEFTIRATDVLKPSTSLIVSPGDSVIAERPGGRVRYPDGRIIRYGFVGEGSPMKGGKYLFFLSQAGQGNFRILTGYELRGNKVFALDGSRINNGLGRWSFDKHNGEDYEKLRKAVDDEGKHNNRGDRP